MFSAADLSKHCGLSREKMINVAMMTGRDYTDGIENVGPVTSMEVLAEFSGVSGGGLETLVRFRDWLAESGRPESTVREKLRKLKLPESKTRVYFCRFEHFFHALQTFLQTFPIPE